jgi:hypothetical protein
LNVAEACLVISSFFNVALEETSIRLLECNEIDDFSEFFMGREFACVKRKELMLLMFNEVLPLKPITDLSLKSVMCSLLNHYHFVVK